jgi:hypothetical protein
MHKKITILIFVILTTLSTTSLISAQDTITLDFDDILDRIAASFDVSLDCLMEINNLDNFQSEGTLTVDTECPAYDGEIESANAALGQGGGSDSSETIAISGTERLSCEGDRNPGRTLDGAFYTVQSGDILDFIGCDLNISTICLIETNTSLQDPTKPLRVGQRLNTSNCGVWQGPYSAGERNR